MQQKEQRPSQVKWTVKVNIVSAFVTSKQTPRQKNPEAIPLPTGLHG
jgi:hypothetical protein